MNNEQEKSRLYEIVAQSIQKRIIYPSRENVTLNHDTWEYEYEPVYEENPQYQTEQSSSFMREHEDDAQELVYDGYPVRYCKLYKECNFARPSS